ncbi:hypothetical protein MM_2761 [Methanosarcina mazei Go1]|uniref:Uncharacterized protein n=1 Tax=Methanosarcina mazei (strain ATCC BAA-159 / DSM 3647 / Goe1 / Go1 / JCM 11833 / OCM 88) TaxID=192952 RepID=Q8PTF4_METMA|nr:hypothetical protein [Methanosarcina mazei]AAM32457.1 hypothetical protein MM_2761 [Methanosarcina mazei Go1]WIM42692.1 hypothetical protein PSF70_14520 [Methanosarcina mazei]WIM46153.1 hypothetical protein PQQ20_14410 [Methanosarcina mazei]
MGFLKNIAGKASKWAYNDAKKTYENGRAYYNYKMQQAEKAQKERKQAETAIGGGYIYKGLFGASAIEKMHLNQAAKHYKDNGYAVMRMPVTLSNGKQGIRLYVKKSQKKTTVKAPAKKIKVSRSKKLTKAKGKAFKKTVTYSNKRYTLASNFRQYGDRAKAYGKSLKQQGFAVRIKTLNVNGITNYAVYTRNPSRR